MKRSLISKKVFIAVLIVIWIVCGTMPYEVTKAAVESKGYLLLVEDKDGTWIEYGNCVEIKSKDKLMVSASKTAEMIGIKYNKKDAKTFTLSNGKKKNTYTKDAIKYKYYNGSKTVTKTAAYPSYSSTVNKENMVEYSSLTSLVAIKLYQGKEAGDYQKVGYSGVICLSQYHKITKLPEMEAGTRVSTEKELQQAAADAKVSNIIIVNDITTKEDFTCEREENSVSIHIQKGKTLTIDKSFLQVGGTLKNDGTILVKGSLVRGICNLENYGAVVIDGGGSAESGMSDLNNYGSFKITRGASLLIDRGSAFFNKGDLLNEGTIGIDNGGSFTDNGGKLTNNGVINLYTYYNGDISLITGTGVLHDYRKASE